ncbi:MAG: NapC/NirT family cytochrome c [Vicinamibacteria bacterium]
MPGSFHNKLSWAGSAVALFGAAGIVFFAAFDHFSTRSNPYWGIFAWVVFPAIMLCGALGVAAGMARERVRRRSGDAASLERFPIWDFNLASSRRLLVILAVGAALFFPLSAVGSYHAYEVSESVPFCGSACHTSMSPEHTAFAVSPHSAVKCVDCHVGPGASGYVEAKTSGVRRLWKAVTNTYSRPIPPALQNLPHSSATCASCHAPGRLGPEIVRSFAHFAYDEANTPRQIDLLMNVGGRGDDGSAQGIHAHQSKHIEFGYLDENFQTIAWVRLTQPDGKVTEYRTDDPKVTKEIGDRASRRVMDCADCHNRTGHTFETPDRAVNMALLHGRLDSSLPFLKKRSVELLAARYETAEQADVSIATGLRTFYAATRSSSAAADEPKIAKAIDELRRIYHANFFPEMKASWETFPSNIGHFSSPGCFRCHGGTMKTAEGKMIPKDCALCHTVIGQSEGKSSVRIAGKEFTHPIDMGDLKDATCVDCHTGKGIAQ